MAVRDPGIKNQSHPAILPWHEEDAEVGPLLTDQRQKPPIGHVTYELAVDGSRAEGRVDVWLGNARRPKRFLGFFWRC